MIFDVLKWRGEDMTKKTLLERQDVIKDWLLEQKPNVFKNLRKIMPMNMLNPKMSNLKLSCEDILSTVKTYNMEGIVVKKQDSNYSAKWLKFKYYEEYDFKITGINSKIKLIASLRLENSKGEDVGSVNYQGEQSQEIYDRLIGSIAVVRCMWTNKNKVRFPVLKEIRYAKEIKN